MSDADEVQPRVGVIVVASSMDPTLMLEAMRAGVTEFVAVIFGSRPERERTWGLLKSMR